MRDAKNKLCMIDDQPTPTINRTEGIMEMNVMIYVFELMLTMVL